MTAENTFSWGILIGALMAAALVVGVYTVTQQLAIGRYLRAHPEERARLRWPGRRLRRRTLDERG